MDKKLILTTDENTISLTVRFYYSFRKLKTEDEDNQYFDLNIIVKNDVTCQQLLEAIRYGLEKKLVSKYNLKLEDIKAQNYEVDSLNPNQGKGNNFNYQQLSEQDIYSICWIVFNKCYSFYQSYQASNDFAETKQRHLNDTPIARGYIDFNSIKDGEVYSQAHENQIWLIKEKDDQKTLKELGFISSSHLIFDYTGKHTSAALFQKDEVIEAFQEEPSHYNISDCPLLKLDDDSITIIPPTDPPQERGRSLLMTLLPGLLMAGMMILVRLFMGASSNLAVTILYMLMPLVTVVIAIINYSSQKKEFKQSVKDWRNHYETYIRETINKIKSYQAWDINQLQKQYPPKMSVKDSKTNKLKQQGLVEMAQQVNSNIYSRGLDHPDFLSVRLGTSGKGSRLVPSVFKVIGEKKDVVFTSTRYKNLENRANAPFSIILGNEVKTNDHNDYLINLPAAISQRFAYLEGAPVLLNLQECGTLGIVLPNENNFQPLLDNMLLDLCFYHAPENLQCIFFGKETSSWQEQQEIIKKYAHLPHFKELLGDLSAFAFNHDDAKLIMNRLLEILLERKKHPEDTNLPHILFIIQEEYGLKKHSIHDYLPKSLKDVEKQKLGISYIFCKQYAERLPNYCGQVIKNEGDNWYLLPHVQYISRPQNSNQKSMDTNYQFNFIPDANPPRKDKLDDQEDYRRYFRVFKILSSLYYDRVAQEADIPANVGLLELYDQKEKEAKDVNNLDDLKKAYYNFINKNWTSNFDITKSLKVPLGKTASGIIELDLHEKGDGPHMLVAGTTGSGKTETILTLLICLCTFYSPKEVNLLLMDMKGAGFIKRIGDLPHVVGKVTDIEGDENGTGMLYTLKRFHSSMEAEEKRRKLLLSKMGVDSIDGYINAKRDIEKHLVKLEKIENRKLTEKQKNEIRSLPDLAHLFLVIDEFTELMSISSDNDSINFKSTITSLARVGRTLGFHLILISQNIEAAITPDIKVNSRAKLCLKVATKQASKEMIDTDLAASPLMPGNGRAYLLVGNGSRFEYFQSGYSGLFIEKKKDQPLVMTQASMSGEYELFYDSLSDNPRFKNDNDGLTQLQMMVNLIKERNGDNKIRQSFLPPLASHCYYDFDLATGTGKYLELNEEGEV